MGLPNSRFSSPAFFAQVRPFVGFLLVGGSSSLVSLGARVLFNFLVFFEAAVILAHLVGMLFSYALNRLFIFPRSDRRVSVDLSRYCIINIGSLAITTLVSAAFFRLILPVLGVTFYPALIAHFLGLAACAIPSYLGHKYFSFARPPSAKGT
jgi:putative flippase GtrA